MFSDHGKWKSKDKLTKKKFWVSLSEIIKSEIRARDAEGKQLKWSEQKSVGENVLETEERQKRNVKEKSVTERKTKQYSFSS